HCRARRSARVRDAGIRLRIEDGSLERALNRGGGKTATELRLSVLRPRRGWLGEGDYGCERRSRFASPQYTTRPTCASGPMSVPLPVRIGPPPAAGMVYTS